MPATLDNIKKERRFELAFEGVRYYDLLRWHDERLITENQTDIQIYDRRVPVKKSITYRPDPADTSASTSASAEYYTLQGTRIFGTPHGLVIRRIGSRVEKLLIK